MGNCILTGLVTFAVSLGAYYALQIREPILDLQNRMDTLKEEVAKNSEFNEEVKKYIYSHEQKLLEPSPSPIKITN